MFVVLVSSQLCSKLKYLINYWLDGRDILYRIYALQRINPNDLADPLSFPIVQPANTFSSQGNQILQFWQIPRCLIQTPKVPL